MKFILEICEMLTVGRIAYLLVKQDYYIFAAYMVMSGVLLGIRVITRWGLLLASAGVEA